MKYIDHYDRLINRAKIRILPVDIYFEKHHIIPRCMGGTDDEYNLVKLTAEEHFVAHQLLVKIYPENKKLIYALTAMCMANKTGTSPRNNKMFGWIKRIQHDALLGHEVTEETRKKISKAGKGRKHTEKTRKKMSKTRKGKGNAFYGKTHTTESRKKMSVSKKGKPSKKKGTKATEEAKQNQSKAAKGKKKGPQERVVCPHCNQEGGNSGMKKYHFDNCLDHPDEIRREQNKKIRIKVKDTDTAKLNKSLAVKEWWVKRKLKQEIE